MLLNLVQEPGLLTFDTKLDLVLDPGGFMERSLQVWNPDSTLGELQNQASGYLLPLGPLFWLGSVLPVPMWVWQRLVSALLMVVAYEGARRLVRAWGGPDGADPRRPRYDDLVCALAGAAYALAPRAVGTSGALIGEALPGSILPWTVLPLVLRWRGHLRDREAILLSVATVPFMGGHNATETLSALVLPGIVVLLGPARGLRHRLVSTAAWCGGVVAVTLWWSVSLVVLGRFGSPFLSYIESARTTTDRVGWLSALRGTDHWIFLIAGQGTSWEAGSQLTTSRWLLLSTAMVGLVGVIGLCTRHLSGRVALAASLLVGMGMLTAGSGPPAGSLLDPLWTAALDGPLAPFRNVHKIDPVVRAVLAVGLAAAIDGLRRAPRPSPSRERVVQGAIALVAIAVAAGATPLVRSDFRDPLGFAAVPEPWTRAVAWLRAAEGPGTPVRTVVLPGVGFAVQTWGRTTDEPIQALDPPPWSVRGQTPLVAPGAARWLDSVESTVATGRPTPWLAPQLARAGVTHVVVRHDLDPVWTDAPPSAVVHQVVDLSPGLRSMARFGQDGTGYPLVEVYAVDSSSVDGVAPDPRARLLSWQDARVVQGAAEAVPQLIAAGELTPQVPMLRPQGAPDDSRPVPDVLTDSARRVERNFGRVHDSVGPVLTAAEDYRSDRAAHDYVETPSPPLTVATYPSVRAVVASTSTAYPDSGLPMRPEEGPDAALDGSLFTGWRAAPFAPTEEQWWAVRFSQPTVVGRTRLFFDVRGGAEVTRVAIFSAGRRVERRVRPDGRVRPVPVATAPSGRLRVRVLEAEPGPRPVVLSEVRIAGVDTRRSLLLPGRAGAGDVVSVRSQPSQRACYRAPGGLLCDRGLQRISPEAAGFQRRIGLTEAASWRITGHVVAAGGQGVTRLLEPLDPARVTVAGSSWFAGEPLVWPGAAFDGDPTTAWVADDGDPAPALELRWVEPRTIDRVFPTLLGGFPGLLPSAMTVISDEGTQTVPLGDLGSGVIDPVSTTFLRVEFPAPSEGNRIAISELRIDPISDLAYQPDPAAPTRLTCGFGPRVRVGGRWIDTQAVGTVADLQEGAPLAFAACGAGARGVPAGPGPTLIEVQNASGFEVVDLTLTGDDRPAPPTEAPGVARVDDWGSDRRVVDVDVDVETEAVLVVTQASNRGWVASLDGEPLDRVEVDGWMQGYRLPAGAEGSVELVYTPQRLHLAATAGGLVLALGAVLAALVLLWRRRGKPTRESALNTSDAVMEEPGLPGRRRGRGTWLWIPLLLVVSAPAAAGGLAAWLWSGVGARGRAVVAGGLVAAAVAWTRIQLDRDLAAPDSADLLVALAVGWVIVHLVAAAPDPAGEER